MIFSSGAITFRHSTSSVGVTRTVAPTLSALSRKPPYQCLADTAASEKEVVRRYGKAEIEIMALYE
jgi:hypothetical protein